MEVSKGLNLVVDTEQTVAFVGHIDCGKSTTVGLLKWLHEREGGTVMIDASNVRDLNIEWIRNIIAVVQLEPVLFSDTVEGKRRSGNPNIDGEQMIAVCKMANAHVFFEALTEEYV
uniref:ABC transporter domain-containing protein n=1 Tax=Parascaris equorum TaxID=6256 RepID=A0A914RSU1_PAREQ